MSVGQSSVNTSNYLTRSTNLPTSSGDFAISGWFYVSALPSSGNLGTIFSVSHASGWHWIGINSSGNVLVYDTVAVAFSPTIATVAAGDYVYVALGRSSAGNVVVGYASVNNGTSATQTVSSPTGGALTALRGLINGNGNVEGGAGYLDHVRVWNSIPTQTEVDSERTAATAVRTTDLLSDSPLPDTSTLNGWSITGTLSNGTSSPYVSASAQTLTPSLFSNSNSFFTPTVAIVYTSMFDGAIFDSVIFDVTTGASTQTLTPSLFTNTNTFYGPTVTRGTIVLEPTLVSNTQTFYTPVLSSTYTLVPSVYTNTQEFFPASISAGTVDLTPSLFTNDNTFYTAVVNIGGGPQNVTPSLFENINTFHSATVTTTVELVASRFDNTNVFYDPVVSAGVVTLLPELVTNTTTFYTADVTPGVVTLEPTLVTNSNTFFSAVITQEGGTQTLLPDCLINSQVFYPASVSTYVEVTPTLFTNDNTFYTSTVTATNSITPDFLDFSTYVDNGYDVPDYTEGHFFSPTISRDIAPELFTNTNVFYSATVYDPSTVVSAKLYLDLLSGRILFLKEL